MLDQFCLAERKHFLRRIGDTEQFPGCAVHPDIRCLRRQDHCDEKRVGVLVIELSPRFRHRVPKATIELRDVLAFHRTAGHAPPWRPNPLVRILLGYSEIAFAVHPAAPRLCIGNGSSR